MNLRITLLLYLVQLVYVFANIPDTSFCSSRSSSFDSSCNSTWQDARCPSSTVQCLDVLWTEFKPYTYLTEKAFSGIIPGIFGKIIDYCCKSCWKVNVTAKVSRQSITAGKFPDNADIVLPYSTTDQNKEIQGMQFVSFRIEASVVYITKKERAGAIPRKLIGAVWNAWPVLIMALLLSLVSGILLWFLELWRNPDEFPRSFLKGSWEGFWWAFVSMTTVGYGDRSPRSILGRSFAIFWIMIGICICSIFTATLTTSLTTITLEEQKMLARAKVGAIKSSLEASAGVNSKAKVINYNSTQDLWRALHNDQVEGILLDSYFSASPEISGYIADNNFKISQTVKVDEKSYGILVRNKNLTKCLNEYFESPEYDKDSLTDLIAKEISSELSENEAAARSDSIFNPTGDIFWPSLYVCIGCVVIMLIAGLFWEFFLMEKCYKRGKTGSTVSMKQATNLDEMEKEMIADVQKLFAIWRAKREMDIGISGPMEVVDVEHNGHQMSTKQSHQSTVM